MHQKTLRRSCEIRGIGLHTGKDAKIVVHPAPADHGVVFRVTRGRKAVDIKARAKYVNRTRLSTCIGRKRREVCTVEHFMAAVYGLEIDNLLVEVEGGEVPVMDGSALPFVNSLRAAGYTVQPVPKRYIRVLEPIVVKGETRTAGLYPSPIPIFSFEIDFDHPAIKVQSRSIPLTPRTFVNEISKARTFGFEKDLQALQRKGLALGVGLENCVGLGRDGSVLNPEGLRYEDEFVRHKILDAIGDLSLAGYPLLAEYRGQKSGHALNLRLVQALLETPENWELIDSGEAPRAQAV